MPGLLNTSSIMMCPHGGMVTAISGNTRVRAAGEFVLRASDTFIIAGCAFTLPPPHPCVQINWVQPDVHSKVSGDFTLSEASMGLCVAADQAVQGTVIITSAQPRVAGS
jgi:hypothetical protein